MKKRWVLGTRGSKLALRQTEIVMHELGQLYPDCQFIQKIIKTTGDTIWDTPLHLIGGKGLFVKEIEEALLSGEIDMAVHSMKDMPVEFPEGLLVGAVLPRENPRDAFVSVRLRSLSEVGDGSRVGTGSLRRKAQLLHFRKGVEVVPLRGNVDTRIRKLKEQGLDAIILAFAGIKRMGYEEYVKEVIPFEIMVPPSGQGAIGIETRAEAENLEMLKPLNHEQSLFEVTVERKLQALVGGGCSVPLGINASVSGDEVLLSSALGTEDGRLLVKQQFTGKKEKVESLIVASLAPLAAAQKREGL